ncbi:MAG: 1-acyl-sn-glycerol-3-phosphate acyltransferase [Planctomycetes bacterium]|nr:1-acyl-sn-glycerol-3-phosphate acyltransferase [Planctomycetota bacterium]
MSVDAVTSQPPPIAPIHGPLAHLRAWRRAICLLAVTGAMVTAWLVGALPLLPSRAARSRWRRVCMRGWCRGVLWALGGRLAVRGAVPTSARFLVCNHLSYIDIVALGSVLPVAFVARADVAGWPLIGPLARAFDTVFITREVKRKLPEVNAIVARRIADGCALVVFAEGTTTAGDRVLPLKPSLLEPAVAAGVSVQAACLHYVTEPPDAPASVAVCWVDDVSFMRHGYALLALRRIDAELTFAPTARTASDRKELAAALDADVRAMFSPMA